MNVSFFILSFGLALALAVGVIQLGKIKHELVKDMQLLFVMAIVTIMWNAVGVISKSETFATFAHGVYFACTVWLVIVLLSYTKKFIEYDKDTRIIKFIVYVFGVADTISLAINPFMHHLFRCELVTIHGYSCYTMVPNYEYYRYHLCIAYGIALCIVLVFIYKTITSTRIYRQKYLSILLCFFVILVANVGYRFLHLPIDFSSIFYSLLAVVTVYFSIFYVPRGLVTNLLEVSVRNIYNGIVCFDRNGKCLYCNGMAVKLLKLRDSEMDVKEGMEGMLRYLLKGRNAGEVEDSSWQYEQQTPEGTLYIKTTYAKMLDEKGNYLGCSLVTEDKTKDIESLREEHYRATHDSLTQALNREGFFDAVRRTLDEHSDKEWYMICSDIKNFKLVNDLFGVMIGDAILMKSAEIIRKNASEYTVFGRLSADRFAIFMLKEKFDEKLFERCFTEIESMAKNDVYRMHIHLGVYRVSDPTMEIAVMCDRALLAIKEIKNDYEQIIAYYDEDMGQELHDGNKMINEFDRALEEGQFKMFLQPQIAVDSRKVLGAEALVRWFHPEKGMIPPFKFIPLFEKSGQIYKLDCYVWELACKKLQTWKEQGKENLHISVNISPKDFYYVNIYETFTSLVEKYDINPKNLNLEITETALMTDLQQQLGLLQRLRDYGFSIEVDDFGSGYSSLNTLKDIEVDVLKIDMGFLSETEHKERTRTILNSIISMSKKLGLVVVTEGVETDRQVAYLTDAGCDIFQGYYFDKPMPVDEFEDKYFKAAS